MRIFISSAFSIILIIVVIFLGLYATGVLGNDGVVQVNQMEYASGGFTFSGELRDGQFCGDGTINFQDGSKYSGGFTADVCCSIGFFAANEAYLFGETGCIRISPQFNSAESAELFPLPGSGGYNLSNSLPKEKFSGPSGFEFQIAHTLECVRMGKTQSDLLPLTDTIEVMEIIDRVIAV